MIVISELISTEHNNMYLYSQVTSRCQNIFSLGKLMNRNFLKKNEGVGGSFGKISKSTVVLFCYSIRKGGGWVVIFRNFEKSAYVPSKKYLLC